MSNFYWHYLFICSLYTVSTYFHTYILQFENLVQPGGILYFEKIFWLFGIMIEKGWKKPLFILRSLFSQLVWDAFRAASAIHDCTTNEVLWSWVVDTARKTSQRSWENRDRRMHAVLLHVSITTIISSISRINLNTHRLQMLCMYDIEIEVE